MTNMTSKLFTITLFLLFFFQVNAQEKKKWNLNLKTEINVRKSGPYIGLQKGIYTVGELGGELQWKKLKWIKPFTNALHVGMNYNFKYNVIGYDFGYWCKTGRLNLTYGANICYRSNFTHSQVGIAPVIGFKFTQFHLQTGYNFLSYSPVAIKTNTLFISLRFVLINNRNVDFD